MGGSGGRGFFPGKSDPHELIRQVRDAEAQTENQQFDIDVGTIMAKLLADFNDRDVAAIDAHLNTIRDALGQDIDGTIKLLFGGSVGKRTYVDGLSDIDALVLIDRTELRDLPPSQVLGYFADRLSERLPNTPLKEGSLAVTVSFTDSEIQLVPALKHGEGFIIPAGIGDRWSPIRPKEFSTLLTELNRNLQNKLVPTIKLAKAIIARLPEDRRLSGYHTEALAVLALRDYHDEVTPKGLLKRFFLEAPKYVLTPVQDPTGQSTHVDEHLGAAGSLQRRLASDSLQRIGRRMQNADGGHLLREWKEILGVPEEGQ